MLQTTVGRKTNSYLPQLKYHFNIQSRVDTLPQSLTKLSSGSFHPYANGLDVDHLIKDTLGSIAFAVTKAHAIYKSLIGKRALISFVLANVVLFGIGNPLFNTQISIQNRGTLVSANQVESMAVAIVADNVPNFIWPVTGGISTKYSRWHPGLDIPKPKGTPIKPIADGRVTTIENGRFGYGKSVIVTHSGGFASRYAHLSKIDVKVGDIVTNETTLGGVGNTGRSTGNHLHFEIYENGKALNPYNVLPSQESLATHK